MILGRATNEIDVDIDLSKEGRANKISRRQVGIFVISFMPVVDIDGLQDHFELVVVVV